MEKRILNYIIRFSLIISPIAYMQGKGTDLFDLVVFYILSLSIILISFITGNNRIRPLKLLLISLGVLISIIINSFNPDMIMAWVNLCLGISVTLVVANNIENLDAKIFFIPIVINFIVLAFQIFGDGIIIVNPLGEPGGLFGNAPRLGMYLAIVMPLTLKKHPFWTSVYATSGAMATGEIYLAIFLGILALNEIWDIRKVRYIILCLGSIGLLFSIPHISNSFRIRWEVWKPTLDVALARPWFGNGIGIFSQVSNQFIISESPRHAINAFSSLLQFFWACGLAGLIPLWIFLKDFFKKWSIFSVSILFLCLLCLTEYPFEVPKLYLTILIILGVAIGKRYKSNAIKQ